MEQKLCYFVAHREQKSEGYDKFLEMGALNPKFCDGQKNRKRRTSLLETKPIKQKQNRKKNNNKRQKKKKEKKKPKRNKKVQANKQKCAEGLLKKYLLPSLDLLHCLPTITVSL